MKRKLNTPQFIVRPKTFIIMIPFIVLVLVTLYFGLRSTTFTQPQVSRFDISCPVIQLSSTGVDSSLVPSEGYSEGSGMVASRKNPGVFWVHSDELVSGTHASVWAITETGEFITRYDLPASIPALDTEDIAIGGHPRQEGDFIYLGAFGDNDGSRAKKLIARFEEPLVEQDGNIITEVVALDPVKVETLAYTYNRVAGTKQYDAEGLLVDPVTNDIYIFAKNMVENNNQSLVSFVFKINAQDFIPHATGVLSVAPIAAIRGKSPVAKGKNGPTSAAISFDGSQIAVVNRSEIFYWERPQGKTVEETLINSSGLYGAPEPCKATEQARNPESVTFSVDGTSLYTINEKFNARLYKYDLDR